MNKENRGIGSLMKRLEPLTIAVIKLYIPVIAVLLVSALTLWAAYYCSEIESYRRTAIDCMASLKSSAGLMVITLLITRVINTYR